MTKKVWYVLVLAWSVAISSSATPWAGAQETGEKNTAEKSATEKNAADNLGSMPLTEEAVELRPVPGNFITLRLTDDSRLIYETLGKLAGISVIFDPDYASRSISVDLNRVSLHDALDIVGFESRSFWRPVTRNTIFVAADTPTKRHEFEQSVTRIFYLSNIAYNTEMQDAVNALRAIAVIDRVQSISTGNIIIARSTPAQLALAQRLLEDIAAAKKRFGQYRLEFRIREMEGEKAPNAKTYALLTKPHERITLCACNRSLAPMKSENNPDKKVDESQLSDVGQNITYVIESESEHTVGLSLSLELTSTNPRSRPADDAAPSVQGQPFIQQIKTGAKTVVELGKPTVILSAHDPGGNLSLEVEVTATRVQEKD
jgi:hypothetical protein